MAGKKGKKGKGKGKKGSNAPKEPQMTAQEAILAYQINVMEKKVEDILYDTRGWEEKNRRNVNRNETLKQEQELLLKHLLKSNRELSKFFGGEGKTREDVVEVMKDKWKRQREREKELEALKSQIALYEVEIEKVARDVSWWQSFRDSGQHKLQMQIKLLEQELKDMEGSFVDMTAHLTRDKEQAIGEIGRHTEDTLSQQKDKASEKAMAQLDKKDRQEVLDNDWLKREVAIHSVETEKSRQVVEDLEKGNLQLMSELFECSIEDLKISRNFFLTQFQDSENLDETGILEMDLSKINVPSDDSFSIKKHSSVREVRPMSATQKAIEDKVFSIVTHSSVKEENEDSEDENSEVDSHSDIFENYYFEEEDFDDYLQLGPLELKLLNITGAKVTIHEQEKQSKEETESKKWNPDTWPVTQPMLQGPLLPAAKQ